LVAGDGEGRLEMGPEQETYTHPAPVVSEHFLGFVGPGRYIGVAVGDPERDTFGSDPTSASKRAVEYWKSGRTNDHAKCLGVNEDDLNAYPA
jgi:hypothetical protein